MALVYESWKQHRKKALAAFTDAAKAPKNSAPSKPLDKSNGNTQAHM